MNKRIVVSTGSSSQYYHKKARNLFAKDHCENCGKLRGTRVFIDGDEFNMHCTSVPKDYKLMTPENWMTLCNSCHTKVDHRAGNRHGLPNCLNYRKFSY